MTTRFTNEHIKAWQKEGAFVVPEFFNGKEIEEVAKDFEVIFPGRKAKAKAINEKEKGEVGNKLPLQLSGRQMGRTTMEQFQNFENIPFDCSSSLNLISVHPSLIEFARAALGTNNVRLYQAQAWAKIHW